MCPPNGLTRFTSSMTRYPPQESILNITSRDVSFLTDVFSKQFQPWVNSLHVCRPIRYNAMHEEYHHSVDD